MLDRILASGFFGVFADAGVERGDGTYGWMNSDFWLGVDCLIVVVVVTESEEIWDSCWKTS
jgi:hypothetical protein